MQTKLKPQSLPLQLFDLVLIQLSNWRWSWRGMVITGILTPLASMAALGLFARDGGERTLGYILTGNLVMALMFDTLSKVSGNFVFMRTYGTFHYFASLPVQRISLIVGTLLAFLILSLPSIAITILAGSWLLHLDLVVHPLLLLVIPVAAVSLAGIGALIGILARSQEEVGSMNLLVTFVMLGLGPVIIPPERLPGFLVAAGWFSPASYAASALRQTLLGPLSPRLALDLAVLILVAGAVLWWVGKRLEWRQDFEVR